MNTFMINTRDIILSLKKIRTDNKLSIDKILILMESKGRYVSRTTIARVFRTGSEDLNFSYEMTLRPIAEVLYEYESAVGIDCGLKEANDFTEKSQSMIIAQYALRNRELKEKLEKLEKEMDEKLAEERLEYEKVITSLRKSIEYLLNQISVKDSQFDKLLNSYGALSSYHRKLINETLLAPEVSEAMN